MNPYSNEEIENINKDSDKNKRMEEFFDSRRSEWNKTIEPLFDVLKIDITNPSNFTKILDAQSIALSLRQQINEQITTFLNKRSKETSKLKKARQDKFIFYATGFGIKTSMGEKSILIDGHLREAERTVEIIESYIDFLRDTIKNLESLSYAVKNMTDLLNYLGR
jgi:threonine synthase